MALAFSPDGRRLVAAANDGEVRMWDVADGNGVAREQPRLRNAGRPVQSVAFSPDGNRVAAGSSDASVSLWDVSGRPELLQTMSGHTLAVNSVAFSSDGTTLVSGGDDGGVVLWDVATGHQVGDSLTGHDGPVRSVAFSVDGRTVFSGGDDRQVVLWDVALDSWRSRACRIANRNMHLAEWRQLGGRGDPPPTCSRPG